MVIGANDARVPRPLHPEGLGHVHVPADAEIEHTIDASQPAGLPVRLVWTERAHATVRSHGVDRHAGDGGGHAVDAVDGEIAGADIPETACVVGAGVDGAVIRPGGRPGIAEDLHWVADWRAQSG